MKQTLIPWRTKKNDESVAKAEAQPLDELHRRMDELFDDFFGGFGTLARWPLLSRPERAWTLSPDVDVSETDDEVRVMADMPGLDEKDVKVTLENDILTIQGEKKQEREETRRNYHLVERSYGEFRRVIPLPTQVVADKVKASFKKGVLTVTMPKTADAKSRQQNIEVTAD